MAAVPIHIHPQASLIDVRRSHSLNLISLWMASSPNHPAGLSCRVISRNSGLSKPISPSLGSSSTGCGRRGQKALSGCFTNSRSRSVNRVRRTLKPGGHPDAGTPVRIVCDECNRSSRLRTNHSLHQFLGCRSLHYLAGHGIRSATQFVVHGLGDSIMFFRHDVFTLDVAV
jgi:hypothetical protein